MARSQVNCRAGTGTCLITVLPLPNKINSKAIILRVNQLAPNQTPLDTVVGRDGLISPKIVFIQIQSSQTSSHRLFSPLSDLHLHRSHHNWDLRSLRHSQMRSSITHRRDQSPGAPLFLPRHGHDAPYGDSRRLSLQGQTHPWILPPLRWSRSRGRWNGGCNHQKRQHHNCLPRPLHVSRERWDPPGGVFGADGTTGRLFEGERWVHAFL